MEYKTGLSKRVKIYRKGRAQSRGTNGTRAGITNLFDNSILGRVIFDSPDIIALCHATPQTSRRARLSGFAPLHLSCIYYGFSLLSSRSSSGPPTRISVDSFRSLFARQRLVFQPLCTRPIENDERWRLHSRGPRPRFTSLFLEFFRFFFFHASRPLVPRVNWS